LKSRLKIWLLGGSASSRNPPNIHAQCGGSREDADPPYKAIQM
jgi:hypothetical protein